MRSILILFCFGLSAHSLLSQQLGTIRGSVRDKNTQELLIGATVQIEGSSLGAAADLNGNYKINNVPVGSYTIKASLVGYQPLSKYNVALSSGNDQVINFELIANKTDLKEIEITFDKNKSASAVDMVTPLSVQSLTTEEIRSNPGVISIFQKLFRCCPELQVLLLLRFVMI